MATDHGHDPHAHGAVNHETTDIHLDGVGKITVGFVVFMALVVVAMYGTFHLFSTRDAAGQRDVGPMVDVVDAGRPTIMSQPNTMEAGGRTPAGPRLLTNEPLALRQYRAEQATRINGYGWVDRAAGVVHLPIARAIELTAERSLPAAPVDVPAAADAVVADEPAAPVATP